MSNGLPNTPAAPETPKRGLRLPPLTLLQVLGILGLVVGLLVMLDFNRRQAEAQRLEADRARLSTDVARLEEEGAALQTQVAYATTDAAVIEWAHEEGKLVQPGEVLVVPVLPTATPTPPPSFDTLPTPPPNWTLWWKLFFDIAPPPINQN